LFVTFVKGKSREPVPPAKTTPFNATQPPPDFVRNTLSLALSHIPAVLENAAPAVVLVHYGDPGPTRRCVQSLARHESFPHRVIVVDHGPEDGLPASLDGLHPQLMVLSAHENPGFGAGCNLGAARAFAEGAEGVWFLNNDAFIETSMVEELLNLAQTHPEVAFWAHTQQEGGHHIGADVQPRWYSVRGPELPPPPAGCQFLGPRESLSGASLFVSRQQWNRIGPWPVDYFLYYEDAAYCHRARRMGLALALLERAIYHERGTTTGRRSPLTTFYGVRNRLLLHREIHPGQSLARLLIGLDLLQKRLFQFRWGMLKPTWDGLWAAARNLRDRDPRY
jgi:GT2 family glycosyltransferase